MISGKRVVCRSYSRRPTCPIPAPAPKRCNAVAMRRAVVGRWRSRKSRSERHAPFRTEILPFVAQRFLCQGSALGGQFRGHFGDSQK